MFSSQEPPSPLESMRSKNRKSVHFSNEIDIYPTYEVEEYDRTGTPPISRLSFNDATELMKLKIIFRKQLAEVEQQYRALEKEWESAPGEEKVEEEEVEEVQDGCQTPPTDLPKSNHHHRHHLHSPPHDGPNTDFSPPPSTPSSPCSSVSDTYIHESLEAQIAQMKKALHHQNTFRPFPSALHRNCRQKPFISLIRFRHLEELENEDDH